MTLESNISQHGYWALLLGTALEGETILVVAGHLAHRGYLQLPYVIGIATLGTFVGDQTFFQIGRSSGNAYLARHPQWQGRAERVRRLFDRHRITLVLRFRFMYGIRTVAPFVIGMSGFPRKLFVLLNAISAAAWAITVGCAGYAFGRILENWLHTAKQFERPVILSLAAIGIATWVWHRWRVRAKPQHRTEPERG